VTRVVLPVLLAGVAAALGAAGLWETFRRDGRGPERGMAVWFRMTMEPLRRARNEGYLPSSDERLRLVTLLGLAAIVVGWWLAGPVAGLLLAFGAPLTAGWLISRGRRRYRRSVERSLPEAARAIADCLSAGHSPRGAIAAAAASLEGPVRSELDLVRYDLEAGEPTAQAVSAFAHRFGSRRVDAFATALVSQRLAGGDLASLLRRFADGAAEQDRVAEDARSATAQARFTGYLVVAMPAGGALFVELVRPGFLASIGGSVPALIIVAVSIGLQVAGFVAISRLARIGPS